VSGHFLSGVRQSPAQYGLQIARSGQLFVRRLELAGDSTLRKKGLLGRTSLDPDIGFVIAPTQGIHTFGMAFAIDVIGVSRDGRVVRIKANVPARRLVFALRAFAIIEVAAGIAARAGLTVGDQLSVVETAHAAPGSAATGSTR
jgi:uncharacterized protein